MHCYLSMTFFATYISIARSSYLVYTLDYFEERKNIAFEERKNIAEKMDTNAQWFHSSCSILPQRVNIRVRGFHLVSFLPEVIDIFNQQVLSQVMTLEVTRKPEMHGA